MLIIPVQLLCAIYKQMTFDIMMIDSSARTPISTPTEAKSIENGLFQAEMRYVRRTFGIKSDHFRVATVES